MAKYTPEQFGDLLDRFTKGLPEAIGRAMLAATQQVKADVPDRIHNTAGTKDIKGKTRKYRSAEWKEIRKAKGRQINVVDHTFEGDLQRSYKLVQKKKSVDMIVSGTANVEKLKLERFYDNPVWEANKKEADRAVEVFNEQLVLYVNKFFDTRG